MRIQCLADLTQMRMEVTIVVMPDRKMKGAIPVVIPRPIRIAFVRVSVSAEVSLTILLDTVLVIQTVVEARPNEMRRINPLVFRILFKRLPGGVSRIAASVGSYGFPLIAARMESEENIDS